MNQSIKLLITAVAAASVGAAAMYFYSPMSLANSETKSDETAANEPLYWVAPMDANYRRDKPGKSPMGMDLVPVYSEDAQGSDSAGTVKISPEVQFNLGLKTATVMQGKLSQNISSFADIRVDPNQIQHIHPRVSGWIETLHIKAVGDEVKHGDALYDIYSPELVAAQEEYLLALERNNTRLIQAASSRLQALGLIEKQINELKTSRKIKQTLTIYSPSNGVIDALNIAQGFYVTPATSMFAITDLSKVWLNAKVFERDADLIKPGLAAEIEFGFNGNKRLKAKVSYVEPNIEAKTRSVIARIELDNADLSLKPNMFAKVTLTANSEQSFVYVPLSAVIRTGEQDRVVMAFDDGKFKSVEVQTGQVWGDQIAISKGLKAGEMIVSSAQFMVDSESSKTSDFLRIDAAQEQAKASDSVWVEASFVSVTGNKAKVDHPAIPEWQWPQMVMDFEFSDTLDPGLITELQAGTLAHIQISKADKKYLISGIHIQSQPELPTMAKTTDAPKVESVAVMATFNSIDKTNRKASVDHPPIPQWKWPAMTMDFKLAESVNLDELQAGTMGHITIEKQGRDIAIVSVHVMGANSDQSSHSQMGH